MPIINHIKIIFSFFLKISLKSQRAKLFLLISSIPSIIILIMRVINKSNAVNSFEKIGLLFLFSFFIQVLTLFFGTAIINDEISDKTLIYLTTKPISKASILIGKYLANFVISIGIVSVALMLAYFASIKEHIDIIGFFSVLGVAILTVFVYMAFFTLFGTILKKPIMIGLIFAFGWEKITKVIGGTLQNFSFTYYINKLIPGNILKYTSVPASITVSIGILLVISFIFIGISIYTFAKKEHLLSDAS